MPFFRCTIDFQHLQPATVVKEIKPIWYVLLVLDPNKSGHTDVVLSTAPHRYLKNYSSHEILSTTSECLLDYMSEDSEEDELPPGKISSVAGKLAKYAWKLAVLVEIGQSHQEALNYKELISSNPRGKQVRGIYSRASLSDLVATMFNKKIWFDLALLFDVSPDSPELNSLQQIPYTLEV
jgi:hypothetical protein